MKIIRIIFLVIFAFCINSNSQDISQNRVIKILETLYNFEWEKSDKNIDRLIEENPESPIVYHLASIKPLWFYLGSFNKDYLDTFFIFSDKALSLSKQLEKEDSLTAYSAFILSQIYANRSIANARDENYIYAVWESDRMKYYADLALELNKNFYDAHLGLGLYNLAVAQVPSSLQWAIKLAGVNADKEIGIEHLETVTKAGKLSKIDAKFYLSQIFTRMIIDYEYAERLLDELTIKFPKNLLFRLSLGWIEVENGDLNSAEKKFKSILKSNEENYPLIKSLSYYQLGNINFYKGEMDSAIFHYKNYLETKLRNDYEGITNLNLGICFELLDLRDSALVYYNNSDEGNSDLDEDSYAARKGKEYLKDSISAEQKSILNFTNMYKAGNHKRLIDSLKIFLEDSLSIDSEAEAMLLLVQSLIKIKKYDESIKYSAKILELKTDSEQWIHPFALYYGALASFKAKKFTDARLFLNLISDYSDFDYSLRLEGLRYSLQRKINKLPVGSN